ncbi:MAG: hypothetical protein E5X65_24755 [Mesorhizobium sp.]|nr:MAG: hypothetical protein E5X65_24755 [Mesorhizobium sp.]
MSLYSGGWLCEAMAQTSKRASGPLLRRWCCPVWCLRFLDKGLEAAVDLQEIEISANDIRQLVVSWLAQGRPSPTPNQLQSLVDQKVTEKVLFREALALGLDRNDETIKRRLPQKMDFLAADVAAMQEPRNPELRQCFPTNSGRFAVPPHASFRHLYFLASLLANLLFLQSGGRPFMQRDDYRDSTPDQMVPNFIALHGSQSGCESLLPLLLITFGLAPTRGLWTCPPSPSPWPSPG